MLAARATRSPRIALNAQARNIVRSAMWLSCSGCAKVAEQRMGRGVLKQSVAQWMKEAT